MTAPAPVSPRAVDLGEFTHRVVLVGESNPYGSDPQFALYPQPDGCSGHRLMRITGLDEDEYLAIARVNLCDGPWSIREARSRAVDLWSEILSRHVDDGCRATVVMLGVKVAQAFSRVVTRDGAHFPIEPWDVFTGGDQRVKFVSLPHPSGINRIWNASMWSAGGTVERARSLLCYAAPHVRWGGPTWRADHPSALADGALASLRCSSRLLPDPGDVKIPQEVVVALSEAGEEEWPLMDHERGLEGVVAGLVTGLMVQPSPVPVPRLAGPSLSADDQAIIAQRELDELRLLYDAAVSWEEVAGDKCNDALARLARQTADREMLAAVARCRRWSR